MGNFTSNVGSGVDESLFIVSYGGGMDVRFQNFFIGVNYIFGRSILDSKATGTKFSLSHQAFGFRAGINFVATSRITFSVGGQYRPGNLNPEDNPFTSRRSFNQLSAFLVINYAILKTGIFETD